MIPAFLASVIGRVNRWFRIMGLRADIVGYQEDLQTILILNQQGSMAHKLISERLEQAQYELYLAMRQQPAQKTRRKA